MSGTFLRTIVIRTLTKQPLVGLPMPLVSQAPKTALAEFAQPDMDALVVHLVDPTSTSASPYKRFKVVQHRGTHWTSLPKPWLRNLGARVGDMVEVWWTPARDGLALRFLRQEDVASAARLQMSGECPDEWSDE